MQRRQRGVSTFLLAVLFLAAGVAGGLGVAFFTGNLPGIGDDRGVTVKEVQKLNELSSVQTTISVPVPGVSVASGQDRPSEKWFV